MRKSRSLMNLGLSLTIAFLIASVVGIAPTAELAMAEGGGGTGCDGDTVPPDTGLPGVFQDDPQPDITDYLVMAVLKLLF